MLFFPYPFPFLTLSIIITLDTSIYDCLRSRNFKQVHIFKQTLPLAQCHLHCFMPGEALKWLRNKVFLE